MENLYTAFGNGFTGYRDIEEFLEREEVQIRLNAEIRFGKSG